MWMSMTHYCQTSSLVVIQTDINCSPSTTELEGKDVEDLFTAVLSPTNSQPTPQMPHSQGQGPLPATPGPSAPHPNAGKFTGRSAVFTSCPPFSAPRISLVRCCGLCFSPCRESLVCTNAHDEWYDGTKPKVSYKSRRPLHSRQLLPPPPYAFHWQSKVTQCPYPLAPFKWYCVLSGLGRWLDYGEANSSVNSSSYLVQCDGAQVLYIYRPWYQFLQMFVMMMIW